MSRTGIRMLRAGISLLREGRRSSPLRLDWTVVLLFYYKFGLEESGRPCDFLYAMRKRMPRLRQIRPVGAMRNAHALLLKLVLLNVEP